MDLFLNIIGKGFLYFIFFLLIVFVVVYFMPKAGSLKCNSCKNGYDGKNGNGYQPCGCKKDLQC